MKRAQVLLLAVVVLVLCAACAPAVAAPAATPDPVWVELQRELRENVWVCLVGARRFEARLPTGILASVNFHWLNTTDGVRTHTIRVTEETLFREGLIIGYETFLFGSSVDLTEFVRVVAHIEIGNEPVELWFPVEVCPPPLEQTP